MCGHRRGFRLVTSCTMPRICAQSRYERGAGREWARGPWFVLWASLCVSCFCVAGLVCSVVLGCSTVFAVEVLARGCGALPLGAEAKAARC
jgi:hypothetical protein